MVGSRLKEIIFSKILTFLIKLLNLREYRCKSYIGYVIHPGLKRDKLSLDHYRSKAYI